MERLIGIPLETALNGMPGLKYLRSISLAGLNDVKCQFEYGTDYWQARQEVINRIGMISNLPQGVTPTLSPWSPTGEIVRYVLEGPGYTLNQLKAVQDWVLERQLRDRTRRDRRHRIRRDGQAVSDPARHPAHEAVRRDLAAWSRTRSRSRTPTSAATSCPWGPSRTTSGPSATWARESTRSIPADADQVLRDRGREAGGHPGRGRHHLPEHAGLHQAARPGGDRLSAAAGGRRPGR